jgi:predicted phosphodiesterase
MRIAVLSDIHSNYFALRAVLEEVRSAECDAVINLGDTFGYYPWADQTCEMLAPLDPIAVKGNHDALVAATVPPHPLPAYWDAAMHNRQLLDRASSGAVESIRALPEFRTIQFSRVTASLFHGTPDEPVMGRYYPDDRREHAWLPSADNVVLLGHTHYPLSIHTRGGGLVANPGSVGQPRDGDVRASWGILETELLRFEIRRTCYDVEAAVKKLSELGWDEWAIRALRKEYRGPLRTEGVCIGRST